MELNKTTTQKLFVTTIVENKDDLEEKYKRHFNTLQQLIAGLSDKEVQNALNNAVSKDKSHEELSLGLLFVILTDPTNAAKSYRDLMLCTRDGFGLVVGHFSQLVLERFLRFTDTAREQSLWLLRELIRNAVASVDNLCWNLLRHASGGDITPRNISLVESMLDIFLENRVWLDKFPVLVAAIVYAYLRLIEDHNIPALLPLRRKEVSFVIALIRERFADCLAIGRDLVRLLQNVARIPEFEQLWRDILLNPKSLCPTFTGVLQLLHTPTSRRYLTSRLTPDMERKMVFLTSSVRFGYQKRYQEWFQRQYFSTAESQSLRCDLIRFIVGVIHPTNECLCSDIIPRWAVIGWLLTTCTSPVAASNAKCALFYDWFFFDPIKDNIMNIEPAILVMHNSMRSHPALTATLLDFLCRIIPHFYPQLSDKVRAGIFSSLQSILDKRVLPSLSPLFDSPKLDRELRSMVRGVFKEFCFPLQADGKVDDYSTGAHIKEETMNHMIGGGQENLSPNNHMTDSEPMFSDEEEELISEANKHEDDEDDDDIPLAKVRLKEKPSPLESKSGENYSAITQHLDGELREVVELLRTEPENEAKCQAMERLVQLLIQDEDIDADVTAALGTCLCTVLAAQFTGKVFPEELNDESIEDSIGKPLFVIFRNVTQLPEGDSRRSPVFAVLAEMAIHQPGIGYLLLYFLKVCKLDDGKASVYKDFCQAADRELGASLVTDLQKCQEDDYNLLCWMVPEVYAMFPSDTIGNAEIIHLVVEILDAIQLKVLIELVIEGSLVMFRTDSFRSLLTASLEWETLEQYFLWQLVTAHGIPLSCVMPSLPSLEANSHDEALSSILLMLKQERPSADLLKQLLMRDVSKPNDRFVVSVFKCWCRSHESELGDLVATLLGSRYPNTSPNKRKRGGGANRAAQANSGPPTAEQVLGHLDQVRQLSRQNDLHFYTLEPIQKALQQAQNLCTDAQRKRFGDLFALAEVEVVETKPTGGGGGRGGGGRGRKAHTNNARAAAAKRAPVKDISDSTGGSSEEEELAKPKLPKKRKKLVVNSDSD